MKTTIISLIFMLMISLNLHSQGIPYDQEFQVNTYTNRYQGCPSVSGLTNGGFVVCWESWGQDHPSLDIYGQLFDASIVKRRNEFKVNTYSNGDQWKPSVIGLKDGGFVVCWQSPQDEDSLADIFCQIFDYWGEKKGSEFRVNSYTTNFQENPTMALLKDGDFVVCWESCGQSGTGIDVFGQIFESSGIKKGSEFQINDKTNFVQWRPTVAELSDGGFVVCWFMQELGDIYGRIYDPFGVKKGNEFFVDKSFNKTSITRLKEDRFVVCWDRPNNLDWEVYGQIFSALGGKIGNSFRINTYSKESQASPSVALLSNSRFSVCWRSELQDGSFGGIYCQLFDEVGNKIGNEFRVNNYTNDDQASPSIAGLANGGFVVCWSSEGQDGSESGIFGKYFLDEPIIHSLDGFSLIGPLNDATSSTTHLVFWWGQPSSIRECYPWELTFDLYIDTDANFPHPQIIKNIEDTTYTIDSLADGKTYFWKVLAKNLAGDSLWSKQQDWGFFIKPGATLVESSENELPQNFELFQNYPNPFNSSTEIRYSLPSGKANYQVQLKIYDILGRLVKVLVNQEQVAGTYAISWDGTELGRNRVASGVYFYSIEAGDLKSIRKMLMLQ